MNIEYTGILLRAMHYLPFGGQYLIPYEFDADTMQVPRGASDPLNAVLTAMETLKKEKETPMHNRIFIEEDKEFTLDEFAHLVARAVRSVASVDIDKDTVVYSRDDVYFTIVDVLGYINERTPGRFKFDQTTFQHYLIHYVPDSIIKKKAQKGTTRDLARTAIHLEEQTGRLPIWAASDDTLAQAIASIKETQNGNVGETHE